MTDDQYKMVGHSLGINTYHAERSEWEKDKYLPVEFYRNYYCWGSIKTGPSPVWEDLVSKGLAESDTQREQIYYFVTDKGIEVFKDLFIEKVTKTHVIPSKSKRRYMEYLHDDSGYGFTDFLGIIMPKVEENRMGEFRVVSLKYDDVRGEYKPTLKEAKVSYKEKLKEFKDDRKREQIS